MEPFLVLTMALVSLMGQLNNYGIKVEDNDQNPHIKDIRVRRDLDNQPYMSDNKVYYAVDDDFEPKSLKNEDFGLENEVKEQITDFERQDKAFAEEVNYGDKLQLDLDEDDTKLKKLNVKSELHIQKDKDDNMQKTDHTQVPEEFISLESLLGDLNIIKRHTTKKELESQFNYYDGHRSNENNIGHESNGNVLMNAGENEVEIETISAENKAQDKPQQPEDAISIKSILKGNTNIYKIFVPKEHLESELNKHNGYSSEDTGYDGSNNGLGSSVNHGLAHDGFGSKNTKDGSQFDMLALESELFNNENNDDSTTLNHNNEVENPFLRSKTSNNISRKTRSYNTNQQKTSQTGVVSNQFHAINNPYDTNYNPYNDINNNHGKNNGYNSDTTKYDGFNTVTEPYYGYNGHNGYNNGYNGKNNGYNGYNSGYSQAARSSYNIVVNTTVPKYNYSGINSNAPINGYGSYNINNGQYSQYNHNNGYNSYNNGHNLSYNANNSNFNVNNPYYNGNYSYYNRTYTYYNGNNPNYNWNPHNYHGNYPNYNWNSQNYTGNNPNYNWNSQNYTVINPYYTWNSQNYTGYNPNYNWNIHNYTGINPYYNWNNQNSTGNYSNNNWNYQNYTGINPNYNWSDPNHNGINGSDTQNRLTQKDGTITTTTPKIATAQVIMNFGCPKFMKNISLFGKKMCMPDNGAEDVSDIEDYI